MAEAGVYSEEYRRFLEQPSTNMDDSGYFSVQVIASALKVWNLELITLNSQNHIAVQAKHNPTSQTAFICNYKDHWFTVRKLGLQWFNLNSLLTGPELISDTYLVMFLAQLEQEGYSIFIVIGDLPECEADDVLKVMPAVQTVKPMLLSEARAQKREVLTSSIGPDKTASEHSTEDEQLQEALRLSLQEDGPSTSETVVEVTSTESNSPNPEMVRQKRLNFFQGKNDGEKKAVSFSPNIELHIAGSSETQIPSQSNGLDAENSTSNGMDMTEEEMLEAAIKMSMSAS